LKQQQLKEAICASKTPSFSSFIASMASMARVELWAKGHGKHDVPFRGMTNHSHFAGVVELIYMQKTHILLGFVQSCAM